MPFKMMHGTFVPEMVLCKRSHNVAEITDNGKKDERELVQTLSQTEE